jgi:Cu(I)/Ag(I) efflux system membrane fusion protein
MKKAIILFIALTVTVTTFAQTSSSKAKQDSSMQVKYTCPMHPDYISNKPGKCPKCGMDLVKVKTKTTAKKTLYTCPMHPDYVSDKPGSCPKCGMTLVKKSN